MGPHKKYDYKGIPYEVSSSSSRRRGDGPPANNPTLTHPYPLYPIHGGSQYGSGATYMSPTAPKSIPHMEAQFGQISSSFGSSSYSTTSSSYSPGDTFSHPASWSSYRPYPAPISSTPSDSSFSAHSAVYGVPQVQPPAKPNPSQSYETSATYGNHGRREHSRWTGPSPQETEPKHERGSRFQLNDGSNTRYQSFDEYRLNGRWRYRARKEDDDNDPRDPHRSGTIDVVEQDIVIPPFQPGERVVERGGQTIFTVLTTRYDRSADQFRCVVRSHDILGQTREFWADQLQRADR
ncbi:hypothetical protein MMC19_003146 [Ptychographa xylographoides]|nr:hypothetical protein [Ptychographa xylographoides]